jgi:1,4-dihydroxy-2-naphthoate octaprenyltransferase
VAGVLGVARAPFLPLAILLALSGSAAQAGRAVDAGALGWTVLGLVAAHVLVNVLNEINDYRSGIDLKTTRTPFSGGSGALPAGLISVRGAWIVAAVSAVVAIAAAVRLVPQGGTRLLVVIVLGSVTVLFYSPFWLRLGVGEIVAGLGLGGLPVLGAALVQAAGGPVAPGVWWVALAAFAMTANLLLLNTYPDLGPDRAGGRRTMPILIGSRAAALVYAGFVLLEVVALVAAIATGALPAWAALALLPVLAVVPAVRWALAGAPGDMPPMPALGGNVIWNLATHAVLAGVLLLVGGK